MWKHKNFINLQLCAGETWVLNETVDIPTQSFTVNFGSNGRKFKTIKKVGTQIYYDDVHVYVKYTPDGIHWVSGEAYRTLTFAIPPTGDLLTWLQANGTKQSAPTPTLTFKHFYDAGTIGSGTVKFRHYSQTEPIPQLATPQNVSANGTTVSWDAVENATSYAVLADGSEIGTVENKSGYTLTITNNTGTTISTGNIESYNISSISPIEEIAAGETKTFLITFTKDFPDGGVEPYNQTFIYFHGFAFYDDYGSTFSGDGISSVGSLINACPTIIFTNPVIFNGSGSVIFNGKDD